MADLFDVAGVGEHGQHRLNQHPLVPDAPLADLEVLRIALLACRFDMEAAITDVVLTWKPLSPRMSIWPS